MINHYNAFISYKHAPADIKVATFVQRELERFHIPHKIQKKTGKKKIERIFRDKDELPITADLSDTISNALDNADYLIVICSSATRSSIWVEREIKFFLKTHTRREILTVLVDGEPNDVIPEILLSEEKTVLDSNGNPTTINVSLEPLSCDFRQSLSEAKKEELPRLAAAVIGCSYDELMNRRRQYRMKQAAAIAGGVVALSLVFGGYMLYSRMEVKKALDQALYNKSIYLANEAEKRLDNDLRMDALKICLEAMPSEENPNFPVTANAVRALTKATLAYKSQDGNNIVATWSYSMPNNISDFMFSPTGDYILAIDSEGIIFVWDTVSRERVMWKVVDREPSWVYISADNYVLVCKDKTITAYDIEDGEQVWEYTHSCFIFAKPITTDNKTIYLADNNGSVHAFDAKKGEITKTYNSNDKKLSFSQGYLSPDGNKIAFVALYDFTTAYGVFDLSSGKVIKSTPLEDYLINNIEWVDNDSYLVSGMKFGQSSSYYGTTSSLRTADVELYKINAKTNTVIWKSNFSYTGLDYTSGFLLSADMQNTVAYFQGNRCQYYELDTGKHISTNELVSPIVKSWTTDGSDLPNFITNDGKMGFPYYEDNKTVNLQKLFTDDLDKVILFKGVYAHQSNSRDIILYESDQQDDNWINLTPDESLKSIRSILQTDDYLGFLSEEYDGDTLNNYFGLIDLQKDRLKTLEKIVDYNVRIIDVIDGKAYLFLDSINTTSSVIRIYDIKKDEFEDIELPKEYTYYDSYLCNSGNNLYIPVVNQSRWSLFIYNMIEDEISIIETKLKTDNSTVKNAICDGEYVFIEFTETDGCYIFNTDEDYVDFIKYDSDFDTARTAYIFADKKTMALANGNVIKFLDLKDVDYEERYEITCQGSDPLNISYFGDKIYIANSNGIINVYNEETREVEATIRCDYTDHMNSSYTLTMDKFDDSNLLCIHYGPIFSVVDTNSWVEVATIDNCLGYDEHGDRFLVMFNLYDEGYKIGYYNRYTTKELIFKAKEIIGDSTLAEEIKTELGLN